MESLRGVVERITYANEDTGYSVIKVKSKGYMDLVTVVGSMATVNVGSVLYMKGFWTHNAKYGRQFEVREWEETLPASIYGIEKYLSSGLIKGIGPVYAKKIVNLFKEQTLDIIEEKPDCILEVPGIGKKRVEILEVKESKIIMTLDYLISEKELIKELPDMIYLPPFYYSEQGVAKRLKQIMMCKPLKQVKPSQEGHCPIRKN